MVEVPKSLQQALDADGFEYRLSASKPRQLLEVSASSAPGMLKHCRQSEYVLLEILEIPSDQLKEDHAYFKSEMAHCDLYHQVLPELYDTNGNEMSPSFWTLSELTLKCVARYTSITTGAVMRVYDWTGRFFAAEHKRGVDEIDGLGVVVYYPEFELPSAYPFDIGERASFIKMYGDILNADKEVARLNIDLSLAPLLTI